MSKIKASRLEVAVPTELRMEAHMDNQKWVYKIERGSVEEEDIDALNEMGKAGWILCSTDATKNQATGVLGRTVYRRPDTRRAKPITGLSFEQLVSLRLGEQDWRLNIRDGDKE